MMRRVPLTITLLGCAALLGLIACVNGEGASPTPGASSTPSESPTTGPGCPGHGARWAMVVLYEKDGACRHLVGPARLVACRGDEVKFRIFNRCRGAHTFQVDGFLYSEDEPRIPEPDEDYPASPPGNVERDRLFEGGPRSTPVKANSAVDLPLRVSKDARRGFYKYFTTLDSKPDADQQIEVP